MLTALRVLAVLLLGLCAAAGAAWMLANHRAGAWLDDQLAGLHLSGTISAERVRLPAPDRVRLTGARMLDERSGTVVGQVDELTLDLALPSAGAWTSVRPLLLSARGGRVLLELDGDDVTFVRAITAMLDHIHDALAERRAARPERIGPAPDRRAEFLPPMEFRDVEITLRAPGQPELVVPRCKAFLRLRPDGRFTVDIDAGTDGGHVLLEFNDHGLARLRTRGLAVRPVHAIFLPGERALLAEEVAPEGRLDLDADGLHEQLPRAHGVLRRGTLRPPRAPFPLTDVTLPFELRDGRVSVASASMAFTGGTAVASFDYGPGKLSWDLDVVNADFRRDYLALLPPGLDLTWVDPDDGGNLELRLHVEQPLGPGAGPALLRGSGGLLVRSLRLGPTRVEVADMVARFALHDTELRFHEASGRCAGGVVAVRGSVDVQSGAVDGHASVFDVDIARMRRALSREAESGEAPGSEERGARGERSVSGWLQGEVLYEGRIGAPGEARGRGQFSVRGGNLWRVPVLDAVLGALQLANPGASERHRLTVLFDIAGRRYDVNVFKLESPFLSLVGDGKLNRDGTLEIDIVPIKVPFGYVGDLIEYIQSQVVRLELRGTLTRPEVRVAPVRAVTRNVSRFWSWLGGLFSSDPEPVGPPFEPLPPLPESAPAEGWPAEGPVEPASLPQRP